MEVISGAVVHYARGGLLDVVRVVAEAGYAGRAASVVVDVDETLARAICKAVRQMTVDYTIDGRGCIPGYWRRSRLKVDAETEVANKAETTAKEKYIVKL